MALATSRPTQQVGTADLKKRITAGLRELSGQLGVELPGMTTPDHLIDAARAVERNNLDGAGRHLDLAQHTLTPQSLYRHGHTDDEAHAHAKAGMYQVARHDLLIKDLKDAHEHNVNAVNITAQARQARRQPPPGAAPPAQRPAQAAPPAAPGQYPASKNLANARRALELVGPKGYEHGWKYVGGPGLPAPKSKPTFSYEGKPGSFEHARAIRDLSKYFKQEGELATGPNTFSPHAEIIKTALFNAAKSMIMRRMDAADLHMDMAEKAAARLGPTQRRIVHAARLSLKSVPKGEVGDSVREPNMPSYLTHNYPGPGYYPGSSSPEGYPVNPNPLAVGYSNSGRGVELSANTARLAVTPAPLGKPGGPGLYNVPGGKHSDYMEQIVKGLIEKRGMDKDRAYRIAWGALRKWSAGGGSVHPEVRAAASAALAEEKAKGAAARASHGHAASNPGALELGWQDQQRTPKGQPGGGQFTKGGGQQSGTNGKKGGQPNVPKAPGKAALLHQAQADRERARSLRLQIIALLAIIHGHQPKSSQRSAKSGSSTPRQTGAGAQSGKQAATNSPGGKTSASKPSAPARHPLTVSQAQARVDALRAKIKELLTQARADTKAAAKA